MRPFKAQAVSFAVDYENETAQLGAVIVTPEDVLIVAGTVGDIPLAIANAIMACMQRGRWQRVVVSENGHVGVVAMTRGETDWGKVWHVAPFALAQSQAAAIEQVMQVHEILFGMATSDDSEDSGQ